MRNKRAKLIKREAKQVANEMFNIFTSEKTMDGNGTLRWNKNSPIGLYKAAKKIHIQLG